MPKSILKMGQIGKNFFQSVKDKTSDLELADLYRKQDQKTKIAASISAVGIVLFLAVAILFPFRARLFSLIFQKPFSLAAPTLGNGDVNNDGSVNGSDVKLAMQSWGTGVTGTLDQYQDGKENSFDFANIVNNFSATPTTTTSTQWTQDAHDAQRTGFSPVDPLTPWTLLWTWNGPDASGGTGNHFYDAPNEARTVNGGGNIYVPAGSQGLYALNQNTGAESWHVTNTSFNAAPAYDPTTGYVLAGGADGNLYKINSSTGSIAGTYNSGSGLNKAILIVGSFAYVTSDDGKLHKVAISNMAAAWVYTSGSTTATPPAYSLSRDIIIYATNDLYVQAVNNNNGSQKWRIKPTPNSPGTGITLGGTPQGNQFDRAWPVIAEKNGIVLIRMQLDPAAMQAYPSTNNIFPNDFATIRTWLTNNPQNQNLFALSLDTGAASFIPAVGYGSTEDMISGSSNGFGVMGTQPVVKVNADGSEVAYVPFRNGQSSPPDFRWDSHMGEMVLNNNTISGLSAGDLRFIKMSNYNGYGGNSYTYITDEQTPITVAGNTILDAHWAASSAVRITDRSASLGLTYSSPIATSNLPPVMRALQSSCTDQNNTTHYTTCTNLNYVTDGGRYFNGPGFWSYWGVADPPGWKIGSGNTAGTSYSAGFLPRYTYVSDNLMVVEGNGGDLMVFRHSGVVLTPTPTVVAPTPTPTSSPVSNAEFVVGSGFADVVPRQILRADNGKLYIFVGQADTLNTIKVYSTTGAAFPSSSADFTSTSLSLGTTLISVDAAYNGGNIIHVLVNTQNGQVLDYPFDISNNTFKATKTLATDATQVSSQLGTSGLSGMFDQNGTLQVAYWSTGNRITYRAFSYNSSTDNLTQTAGPTFIDDGSRIARHPVLAVSPADNSVTVAWVSPNSSASLVAGNIYARTKSATGTWGSVSQVNSAQVWTSLSNGVDIDQGPALVITSSGTKYLAYIEYYDATGDYGHVHFVTDSGSGWSDQAVPAYSHDPNVAINSSSSIYLIGHGHPQNSSCTSMDDMCIKKRNSDGSWASSQVFASHSATVSFDASPSVKWSAVGFNQPGVIEFIFFAANNGSLTNTSIYYGRIGS
ncbi:PQQ-binding-like beta-propeller repeat protein [Patescibacteria group bacterium]|nr:PQQ-binding-like beta-propeller repeat protein [Patescibacteria group bacterium]